MKMAPAPFQDLRANHYGALLADPPWRFETWSDNGRGRSADNHYECQEMVDLYKLPVETIAAPDCVLFLWTTWPHLQWALSLIEAWGFEYKSCAFCWTKPQIGLGYWTRAQTEPCLLATRGKPKRLHADVRQAIIEPRREHSRKPDGIHKRIERLVGGPYVELFARYRPGWPRRPRWSYWGWEAQSDAGLANEGLGGRAIPADAGVRRQGLPETAKSGSG
jgi:N6-adenosine-specific RNA methylase IME4